MPIVKIRQLAKYGIVSDVDPYDLPPEAFSAGVNARFRNGRVTRAPVFRSARVLSTSAPRYAFAYNPSSGTDSLYVGYQSGRVFQTSHSAETDVSISGYTDSTSEGVWTDTALAGVLYVNREDRIPWFMRTSDAIFQPLTNWDSSWRAKLLRTCGGALVALNVTKSGVSFPTMVKTSSFALAGAVPASWDETTPATNATENILAELRGPIIDAQTFGSNLVIYGREQAYLMSKVNGFELFDYTKLPFRKGAISANCSIEIDGRHYVFGPDDLWMHDGTSEASICDGSNRDYIFSSLNAAQAHLCFVTYNAQLKELHFCYPSGDGLIAFRGGGCNRQAVYNLVSKTWTFDDLPLVYGATSANLDATATYASVTTSYSSMGGSYQDQDGSLTRTVCYVGEASATYGLSTSLYAFDLYGPGSTVAFPVDTNATKGLYLERDGIDLHSLDPEGTLAGYITVSSVWPLARVNNTLEPPISIQFGSSDYYGQPALFDAPAMTYDGSSNYKLDYNVSGRYLSSRISFPDYNYISISGYDLEVILSGER